MAYILKVSTRFVGQFIREYSLYRDKVSCIQTDKGLFWPKFPIFPLQKQEHANFFSVFSDNIDKKLYGIFQMAQIAGHFSISSTKLRGKSPNGAKRAE